MKILKFRLHPGMNKIAVEADLKAKLLYLNDQDGKITGWFQFARYPSLQLPAHEYEVYLAMTGETVPDDYCYVCSHQVAQAGGYLVVHAFD